MNLNSNAGVDHEAGVPWRPPMDPGDLPWTLETSDMTLDSSDMTLDSSDMAQIWLRYGSFDLRYGSFWP